ncbi:MAG: hypothetical protein C0179_01520 [Fervidicoccus sp.]|nr:MAG: hypothetical protein C0179_01520 [Fervidicoccus sp.]
MPRKRRFGISLNEDLAEKLDAICSVIGVSRSSFIQDAIEFGIKAHLHYTVEHYCEGVMIAIWPSSEKNIQEVGEKLEKYKDIIVFNTHLHSKDNCILIASLKGSSNVIANLHTDLKKMEKVNVMYVPFSIME